MRAYSWPKDNKNISSIMPDLWESAKEYMISLFLGLDQIAKLGHVILPPVRRYILNSYLVF